MYDKPGSGKYLFIFNSNLSIEYNDQPGSLVRNLLISILSLATKLL